MAILFAGGLSALASKSNLDMASEGGPFSNKIGSMFWCEKLPFLNNVALEYGNNQLLDHYGTGVSYPYFRIVGKSNASNTSTLNRALRFYGITNNGLPKTGKWIVGARVERSLGTQNTSGPLCWLYMKRPTDTSAVWLPSASTVSAIVYVEVVVDWNLMTVSVFYDGIQSVSYPISDDKVLSEINIGSMYLQKESSGSYLPSVFWDQRLALNDIYAVHDADGDPSPTGRLGSIRIVYTRVGVGSDWGTALASSEWTTMSTSLKKGSPAKTYDVENTNIIPAGYDVVGAILETSGQRSDAGTPVSMEATVTYDSADLSRLTIPLQSSPTKGLVAVPFSPATLDLTKMKVTYKAVS